MITYGAAVCIYIVSKLKIHLDSLACYDNFCDYSAQIYVQFASVSLVPIIGAIIKESSHLLVSSKLRLWSAMRLK